MDNQKPTTKNFYPAFHVSSSFFCGHVNLKICLLSFHTYQKLQTNISTTFFCWMGFCLFMLIKSWICRFSWWFPNFCKWTFQEQEWNPYQVCCGNFFIPFHLIEPKPYVRIPILIQYLFNNNIIIKIIFIYFLFLWKFTS